MREVGLFLRSVASHWVTLMSGIASVLTAIWLEIASKPSISATAFWAIAALCFLLAVFLTWRDQHREAEELRGHLGTNEAVRATRVRLAEFLAVGVDMEERTSGDPSLRPTEKEIQAWLTEVQHYLKQNPLPLDASYLLRFQNPAHVLRRAGRSDLWHATHQYTETLRALISEVK